MNHSKNPIVAAKGARPLGFGLSPRVVFVIEWGQWVAGQSIE